MKLADVPLKKGNQYTNNELISLIKPTTTSSNSPRGVHRRSPPDRTFAEPSRAGLRQVGERMMRTVEIAPQAGGSLEGRQRNTAVAVAVAVHSRSLVVGCRHLLICSSGVMRCDTERARDIGNIAFVAQRVCVAPL